MSRLIIRTALVAAIIGLGVLVPVSQAGACIQVRCPVELDESAVTVAYEGGGVPAVVSVQGTEAVDYEWRLIDRCVSEAERIGYCSPSVARSCPPAEPGRVVRYFVVERRPVVRADNTALVDGPDGPTVVGVSDEYAPGDPYDVWNPQREGCFDITPLNPPPSGAEVFSYFQRLPLPQLTTEHQPPGDGLAGLQVIFYTDSPTTQTFTVDIRGFEVVIEAVAEQFTWHTGDATGQLVSTDPGAPYPEQTIEHLYRSGTYTAHLTVTWGATFSVDGGADADVPGTTTTDGPPVTFDVLQARPLLTNPWD
ncbi:hypothetical protein DQ239_17395 [Blastococcus sp. TF02-09]|uniref:hypothetical protein n=1 Tax=Blastococcus sp. TF02-09 TaxID=2250576 RepID=UPI000DE969BF|nr:hypothetical protein [Blastococcus sp. TF02-9]RBY75122.1 hypothetical protein DQ239_17395 [Blastococcus sp. TF02-9]